MRCVKECAARVPDRYELSAHHSHKWQTKCMARGLQRVSQLVFKCWDTSVRDQSWEEKRAASPAKNGQHLLLCSSPQVQECGAACIDFHKKRYKQVYRSWIVALRATLVSVLPQRAPPDVLILLATPNRCPLLPASAPFSSLLPPSCSHSIRSPPLPLCCSALAPPSPPKAPTGSCSSGQGDSGA